MHKSLHVARQAENAVNKAYTILDFTYRETECKNEDVILNRYKTLTSLNQNFSNPECLIIEGM